MQRDLCYEVGYNKISGVGLYSDGLILRMGLYSGWAYTQGGLILGWIHIYSRVDLT